MSMPPLPPEGPNSAENAPRRELSLLDATCLMVGIIVGSAIYRASPLIASNATLAACDWLNKIAPTAIPAAPDQPAFLSWVASLALVGIWVCGGLIALCGAFCYAELTTTYPESGGTYVFLTKAFGKPAGFAFAWCEFWIIRPANVGAILFVFASYASEVIAWQSPYASAGLALGALLALAGLNACGIQIGKWTQNSLTIAKILGLVLIVVVAWTVSPATTTVQIPARSTGDANFGLAVILVMFAYGGWSDISYVAAEVKNPQRNLSRSLVLGMVGVGLLYTLVNLSFFHSLTWAGFVRSQAVASDVVALRLGDFGKTLISLLICISCLGAANGMIFTGARIPYAVARDQRGFSWLGQWNSSRGVPLLSLFLQTVVTTGLVLAFAQQKDGFEGLVMFSGPFYWGFLGIVAIAVPLLRSQRSAAASPTSLSHPFQIPLYPLPPLVFGLSSLYMVYTSTLYVIGKQNADSRLGVIWAALVVASLVVLILWQVLASTSRSR